MKSFPRTFHLALLAAASLAAISAQAAPKKALVVTTTTGFRHSSIETAEVILDKLGKDSGVFTVDYARVTPPQVMRKPNAPKSTGDKKKDAKSKERYDADLARYQANEVHIEAALKKYAEDQKRVLSEKMSPAALKNYDLIIFANTTGVLPLPDKQAFLDWVKSGKAFVAMHSGSDTFHGPGGTIDPYIEMVGGEFRTHGAQQVVECVSRDTQHPATKHFGASWNIQGKQEEIYEFKNYQEKAVHALLVLEKHPQTKEPSITPVSWCREYGKGKVFYTSLGHNIYVWEMPEYQQHILGGIKWALGLEKGDVTPQAK
jgi:type 1 glutamine amidotransferase